MKPKFRSLIAAFAPLSRSSLIVCALLCAAGSASAASQTWDGDTDANWTTTTNWVAGGVPGILPTSNGTNTTDVATFNAAINGVTLAGSSTNPVINDGASGNLSNNRMIGRLLFDTANAGAYYIGATGSTVTLQVGNNLTDVDVTATVVNSQTINAPLALHLPSSTNGFGLVRNNATSSSATLTLAGGILNATNSTRGSRWTIGGTNTGNNTISGAITLTNTGGQSSMLTKADAGLWILSGANTIGGGVVVNDGTLVAQSANAFGVAGLTVNGGLVRVDGGITLGNNNVTLESSTEIRSNGSNAINKLTIGTAAVAPVISTVSSGDIFSIGNAANTITGGGASTLLNVSGPGTLLIPMANNYIGGWQFNSGTTQLGSNTALGSATATSVTFGASSTAVLRIFGYNPTVTGLSSNATVGTPVIENGDSIDSVLTVNSNSTQTYAGTLTDGSTGKLGLTKGGSGTLTLSGTNTFTGDTVVNNGVLKINTNSSSPNVIVNGGAALSGTGSISGAVTVNNLGHLVPGNSVGTLTAGSLTLESGAVLDCEFGAGNDLVVVNASGGLTLNGGGVNLYQEGTITQFNTEGTYNLFQYTGVLNGAVSNLSILNPDPTKNYAFSADGTNVKLAITASAISQWALATGGSWASAGSWTGSGVPNASGATAMFGSALTSAGIVTLDGGKTVATIAFDNANSYTLAPASSETLSLDNTANSGQAQIVGTNGSHQISAPVSLNSNTVVSVANSGDTISLSGIVSGSGNLTKSGAGSLVLSGVNDFTGNVTVSAGSLIFSTGSMGAGTQLSMGGSTLKWASGNTDDVSDAGNRTVEFLPGDSTWDTTGNNVIIAGSIGNSGTGNLVKTGTGNLTLSGSNNYTGTTTVSVGTLSITSDASLGSAPGSAIPGSLTINSATLGVSGIFTINGNRGIALNSASSTIDIAAASTVTYGGITAGTGKLNLTGAGILNLTAANAYSGGTVINTGATLNLSGAGDAGSGQLALAGGTLSLNRNLYTQNNILIDAAQTGTIDGLNDRVGIRGLTGSGTVTLITRFGGGNVTSGAFGFRLQGNHAGFTGTVNLKSGTGAVNSFAAYFNGSDFDGSFGGATINMSDFARLGGVNNSSGNTMTIGALSGDSTTILSGADYAGSQTYNIGSKNLDTTFAGTINNGSAGNAHIVKAGTGKFTLTGANTYGGTTTVNAGTLAVENATALGLDTTGTTIAGGDVDAKVTVTGGITVTEPWTLGGRQGVNLDSPAVVSLSGNNTLSGLVTPITGGDRYNIQSDADTLTISGNFVPAIAAMGTRFVQLSGAGNGLWSGNIENGTATVFVNLTSTGTWTLSGINTYTGDTTVDAGGTLVLASTGSLKFRPTMNGVSNKVTGAGTANLNGTLVLDLTAANLTDGNTWTLVDVATPNYGLAGISSPGLTFANSSGVWTATSGAYTWTFTQSTGELSLAVAGFAGWAAINGATGQTPDQDHDLDGVDNGVEYFMGQTGSSFTANPGIVAGSITWPKDSAFSGSYAVETSPDLVTWTNVTGAVVDNGTSVQYTLPTGSGKLFVHLVVTPN